MDKLKELLEARERASQSDIGEDIPQAPTPSPSLTKEDLLIQFINMQQQYYADMKDMAHQHAKIATDLINLHLGTPTQTIPMPEQEQYNPLMDADLLGGEIGDSEPTRGQEG